MALNDPAGEGPSRNPSHTIATRSSLDLKGWLAISQSNAKFQSATAMTQMVTDGLAKGATVLRLHCDI